MTPVRTPRRPLIRDTKNPIEHWLTGKLVVRRKDGALRRSATLRKFAWCVALLGFDKDEIAAQVAARDAEPSYRKFINRPQFYGEIAERAIQQHEEWEQRQKVSAGG